MIQFILISDLHFGKHFGPGGCKDEERAKKIRKIHDQYFKNNTDTYLIASGDISEDGKVKQFRNALEALKHFQRKLLIAPGNHDYGKSGNLYNAISAKKFDEVLTSSLHAKRDSAFFAKTEPVVKILTDKAGNEKVLTIGLNSNLKTKTVFDFACGEIGEEQLIALKKILRKKIYSDIPKLVYFHHHPFLRNDLINTVGLRLNDSDLLMATISGRVDALVFGHKHVRKRFKNIEALSDIPIIIATDYFPFESATWSLTVQGGKITADKVQL